MSATLLSRSLSVLGLLGFAVRPRLQIAVVPGRIELTLSLSLRR